MGAWEVTSSATCMLFGCCNGPGSWTPPPLEGCEIANLGSGYGEGVIEQSFATTIGSDYTVSFWAREYTSAVVGSTGIVDVRVYNGSGDDYRKLYTDKTRKIVEDWYAPEIEAFGYEF